MLWQFSIIFTNIQYYKWNIKSFVDRKQNIGFLYFASVLPIISDMSFDSKIIWIIHKIIWLIFLLVRAGCLLDEGTIYACLPSYHACMHIILWRSTNKKNENQLSRCKDYLMNKKRFPKKLVNHWKQLRLWYSNSIEAARCSSFVVNVCSSSIVMGPASRPSSVSLCCWLYYYW